MLSSDAFNSAPRVRDKRLNVLPATASEELSEAVASGRFPKWLHRRLPKGSALHDTGSVIGSKRLHTVCEEAKCPNRLECWSRHTATFLALGRQCTRSCGFCDIAHSNVLPAPDEKEPLNIAESVKELGLKHVVVTMVARDDLSDGGARHIKDIVAAIRTHCPGVTIEILTSDFAGNKEAWEIVLSAKPEIFNYNIETVERLTPRVRHKATYERTLQLLSFAKQRHGSSILVKSGLMVGLGEEEKEVQATLRDLQSAGCDIATIGQYLQASARKLRVKAFITPETFDRYAAYGREIGLAHVYAGPFVRSSYNADKLLEAVRQGNIPDLIAEENAP